MVTVTSMQRNVRRSPLVSVPSRVALGLVRTALRASTAIPQVWSTDWHRLSAVVNVEKKYETQPGGSEPVTRSNVERHVSCNVTTWGANEAMLCEMALARWDGGTSQSRVPRPNWSQALKSHTRSRTDAADAGTGWTRVRPTASTNRITDARVRRVPLRTSMPSTSVSGSCTKPPRSRRPRGRWTADRSPLGGDPTRRARGHEDHPERRAPERGRAGCRRRGSAD